MAASGGGHGGGAGGVLVLDATTGETRAARRLDAPNHNAIAGGSAAIWTTQTKSPGQVLVLDRAERRALGDGHG